MTLRKCERCPECNKPLFRIDIGPVRIVFYFCDECYASTNKPSQNLKKK